MGLWSAVNCESRETKKLNNKMAIFDRELLKVRAQDDEDETDETGDDSDDTDDYTDDEDESLD